VLAQQEKLFGGKASALAMAMAQQEKLFGGKASALASVLAIADSYKGKPNRLLFADTLATSWEFVHNRLNEIDKDQKGLKNEDVSSPEEINTIQNQIDELVKTNRTMKRF